METTKTYKAEIKELKNGDVELEVSLPWEKVEKHRNTVIKRYSGKLKLDGFRQGKIPENVVTQTVGEAAIIGDMAELALQEAYPLIVKENDLSVIGAPKINVTKMASGNPLEFKVTTAVMPEIALPDYKELAKSVNTRVTEIKVEDKEMEEAITHMRGQWVRSEKTQALLKEGKKMEEIDPRSIEIKDEELPELNDEFVKKLGKFENVEDFKTKFRENMLHEKTLREKDKRRAEILDKVSAETKVKTPQIVIDGELNRMLAQFKSDVARAGIEFNDYLEKSGKTIEDLRKDWTPDAEKYAKNQMIMNKIALDENIVPKIEVVEEEVSKIMKNYKDADKDRARIYVETLMTNDLIFEFLEKQA